MHSWRHWIIVAAIAVAATTVNMSAHARAAQPRVIEVTAKRFAFSPDTITVGKGETVTLRVTSEDVIHGLFQRTLKIDSDIQPGKAIDVTITPQQSGKFLVICDHFCGVGHGGMHLNIVVEDAPPAQ